MLKFVLFYLTAFSCIPLAIFAANSEKLRKAMLFIVPVSMALWDRTSINFYSFETYRGTARGMEISLIYLLAITLLFARAIKGRRFRLLFPGFVTYLFYLFTALLAWHNAPVPLYSWLEIWKMLMMGLVFLAIANELSESGNIYPILYGIMAVIATTFLLCLYQRYGLHQHQVPGIFPHQNSMGMFMVLVGPMFFVGWMRHPNVSFSWICGITFILSGLCVFLSLSRGSLIAFPLGCALTAPIALRGEWTNRKTKITILLVAGTLLGAAICLPRIIERFNKAPEASANTRKNLAYVAYTMMQDHPWGVGPNNWGVVINYPEYRAIREVGNRKITEDYKDGIVETIYLVTGAEFGYIGLFALVIFFVCYIIIGVATSVSYRNTVYAFVPMGFVGGLTAIMLQSVLEWVLKQAINFTALMICASMVSVLFSMRKRITNRISI